MDHDEAGSPVALPRTRHIPFRKREIVEMLARDARIGDDLEGGSFGRFCGRIAKVFHCEFHETLESLKDAYFPVDPDRASGRKFSSEELDRTHSRLLQGLEEVLDHANFDRVPQEDIDQAYEEKGLIPVRVKVDLGDFAHVGIFARGLCRKSFKARAFGGLRRKEVELDILERVVFVVRFKPMEYFEARKRHHLPFRPGTTVLKMFRDVPKKDLEILFPNSKVSMRVKDKLMLGVPAIAAGVPLLLTKVAPAFITIALVFGAYMGAEGKIEGNQLKQAVAVLSGLAALGGFVGRQWMKYRFRRFQFQKELSDNLYFRNMVNNAGVFQSLVDAAEEEEWKETVLAYYFLRVFGDGLTAEDLDSRVEVWFAEEHDCLLDFECPDALRKLERLDLLRRGEDGILKVVPLDRAMEVLEDQWRRAL